MFQKYKQKADQFIDNHRLYLFLFVIIFVFFFGAVIIVRGVKTNNTIKTITSDDVVQQPSIPATDASENKTIAKEITFDIEGAVAKPGVYKLPAGSVLIDAINNAGGLSADADRDRIAREINQASQIGDGSKIYIFRNSDKDLQLSSNGPDQNYSNISSNGSSANSSSQPASGTKININTATLEQLDALPGIGPALGQRIIDWRDANGGYEVIDDLKKVKGIGDSVFGGLKDQVVVE